MTISNSEQSRADNFSGRPEGGLNWRRSYQIGLLIVAAVFILMAVLSWRKWPDILTDFGVQLYIPWRLTAGAVLYRDLFYISGGPLSQYYNALLFKIFGPSFLILVLSNLAITAAMLFLIYRRFFAASGMWMAATICLGVMPVFLFAQYGSGNWNYAVPYCHDVLHGLALSVFAIAFLSNWVTGGRWRSIFTAGFCYGMVFLTKPDIFVALTVCVVAAFAFFCLTRSQIRFAVRSLGVFLPAAVIPPAVCLVLFRLVATWHESLQLMVYGWRPLFGASIVKNNLYLWCLGLDRPYLHLHRMLVEFAAVISVTALTVLAAALLRKSAGLKSNLIKSERLVWAIRILLSVMLAGSIIHLALWYNWLHSGASLPLLSLSACLLIYRDYKRAPDNRKIFPLIWSVFGLALLSKLGIFSRILHYGFVLAMPAFISTLYLFFWLLPRLLKEKYDMPARPFRAMAGMILFIACVRLFAVSMTSYFEESLAVGAGKDKVLTFNSSLYPGRDVNAALAWIDKNVPPDATLAVLPEGITINYLSRRINPTPCLFWDPNAMTVFGQDNMTAAFEKNPPDYVLIAERDYSDGFDVGYFGRYPGFGVDVMQWVEKNYEPVYLIGHEPLRNKLFGIKILKRRRSISP